MVRRLDNNVYVLSPNKNFLNAMLYGKCGVYEVGGFGETGMGCESTNTDGLPIKSTKVCRENKNWIN